jgi:hypothetical protein
MQRITGILLVTGALLLLASLAAPLVLGERLSWSVEMATNLQNAAHEYHATVHSAGPVNKRDPAMAAKLEETRREYERYENMLSSAQTRGSDTARILRWISCVALALGLISRVAQQFTAQTD